MVARLTLLALVAMVTLVCMCWLPNNEGKGNYRKRSRSSDDDDDNTTCHINEFRDKVYKKKKPSYQKPRANNYATKVTEGSHKKQDKREKQSHYKDKIGDHKQNTGRKDND